jgi:ankyrin repeat protein
MKNKITLLVLAGFVVLIVSAVEIRKIKEKADRKKAMQRLHPVLAFTLAFSDLTKLHKAAGDNDAKLTEKLIEKGWAVDRRIKGKLTPLHVASMCGSDESAAVLIRHGADVNFETSEGITPLAYAAIGAKRKMVEFLLANGAAPDKKNSKGLMPAEVAQEWRELMAPQDTWYGRTYGEEMEACIEMLRQAADESALSESDTTGRGDN